MHFKKHERGKDMFKILARFAKPVATRCKYLFKSAKPAAKELTFAAKEAKPNSIIDEAKKVAPENPYGVQVGQVHADGSKLYKKTVHSSISTRTGNKRYVYKTRRTVVDKNGQVKRTIVKTNDIEKNIFSTESRTNTPRFSVLYEWKRFQPNLDGGFDILGAGSGKVPVI